MSLVQISTATFSNAEAFHLPEHTSVRRLISRWLNPTFARYLVIGSANSVVDLLAFNLILFCLPLDLGTMRPTAAAIGSFTVALLTGFFAHRSWTYRSTAASRQSLTRFLLCTLSGIAIQALTVQLVVSMAHPTSTLVINSAKILAMGVAAVWSYTVCSRWVFKHS